MRGLTEAFAALLADKEMRALFSESPGAAADRLEVASEARAGFLALSGADVERQVQCLVDKRAHEVHSLIPTSASMQGARYAALFAEYAPGVWPRGHHRHWIDAAGFLAFLKERREPFDPAEARRAAFHAGTRRLGIHFVRRYPTPRGARLAIQVLWRRGPRVRETAIHT